METKVQSESEFSDSENTNIDSITTEMVDKIVKQLPDQLKAVLSMSKSDRTNEGIFINLDQSIPRQIMDEFSNPDSEPRTMLIKKLKTEIKKLSDYVDSDHKQKEVDDIKSIVVKVFDGAIFTAWEKPV